MLPWKPTLPMPVYIELSSCTRQQLKCVEPEYYLFILSVSPCIMMNDGIKHAVAIMELTDVHF